MELSEAIEKRHSVRAYKDMPIKADVIEQLRTFIEMCNKESGLHIQLITNEPKAFDCKLAHYGRFSNVANYIALVGKKSDNLDELCGYYGEKIVLRAQQLGLNTCWVALTYKKVPEIFEINADEKLTVVISLGYGENQGSSHRSKTFSQVTRTIGEVPEWFKKGVEAALLAPTAVNQQKFSFELKDNNKVHAKAGMGICAKIDLGIIKYHFEIGAGKENFEWV